jgi:hypothetical protein
MRGPNHEQDFIFSYHSPADRVPPTHPFRVVKEMANRALKELSPIGRASIPPEKLIRALLLQALYSIRSERLLMEELDYNLLFRWFVGLSMDEEVWDHSTLRLNKSLSRRVLYYWDWTSDFYIANVIHFLVRNCINWGCQVLDGFRPTAEPFLSDRLA